MFVPDYTQYPTCNVTEESARFVWEQIIPAIQEPKLGLVMNCKVGISGYWCESLVYVGIIDGVFHMTIINNEEKREKHHQSFRYRGEEPLFNFLTLASNVRDCTILDVLTPENWGTVMAKFNNYIETGVY